MSDRIALSQRFIESAGWGGAERRFLAGDASDRSYDRLIRGAQTAVLMDAPPGQGDDPATFLTIAAHLSTIGLSAPACYASDLENGFLLLEDLSDKIFARVMETAPALEIPLYTAATEVLAHLQRHPPAPDLPNLSAADWAEAACFSLDWYRFAITGTRTYPTDFRQAVTDAMTRHADAARVMILRDYHAENLLWLPNRAGIARVGLLDFQLAQLGQPAYDLVSLLQDARRDVSPDTETAMIRTFCELTGTNHAEFGFAYAAIGAQRALRILGIFARLCLHGGKPGYLALMPRVWYQLQRNLSAPQLGPLAKICTRLLPEPTPEALAKIGAQCGHFR
ncbi:MAG: aminoglycoside phosphotransferase [Cypionkella sp.]|uniref:aminoglycoside phosphotransferase family protein n=1 Tax=Cypionkella sp. TaxID=2811411 RepID=UPI00262C7B69|nr:phosphotransferase [Cypionkella sp.]MDB5658563.1 aminoglycoside phosphotransferase [Cypionkella sp.]